MVCGIFSMLGHWFAPGSPTWATSGSGAPTCTPGSYGPQFRRGHFIGTHGGRVFFGRSKSRFHECAP
jgi:hypothetical protein